MMNLNDVPEIDRDWLREKMAEAEGDDPQGDWECQDNLRLAVEGDVASENAYEDARRSGCCGFFDVRFDGAPSGRTYLWGFNYGH